MAEIPPKPPWFKDDAGEWDPDATSLEYAELPKPERDKSGRWVKGCASPYPAGRARKPYHETLRGLVPKALAALEAALDRGDMSAVAHVMSRVVAPLRAEADTVQFELDVSLPVTEQCKQVMKAAADGHISLEQAKQFVELIGTIKDIGDVEAALDELRKLKRRGQTTNQPSGVRFAPIEDFIKGTVQ